MRGVRGRRGGRGGGGIVRTLLISWPWNREGRMSVATATPRGCIGIILSGQFDSSVCRTSSSPLHGQLLYYTCCDKIGGFRLITKRFIFRKSRKAIAFGFIKIGGFRLIKKL